MHYRWTILAVATAAQAALSALRQGVRSLAPALRSTFGLTLPQVGAALASVSLGILLPVRDGRIWRLGAGSALLVCAQSGLLGFTVLFLHDARGWSSAAAALALASIHAGGGIARVAAGRWADRLELRVAPMRRLAAGAAALLGAVALTTAAPDAVLVPTLIAAGVFASSWNGLSFTAAAEMSGRKRAGTAMSLQNTILTAACVVVPLTFAALVSATSWQAGFAALTLAPLAGLVIHAPLRDEERARREARHRRLGVPATVSLRTS